MWIFINVRNSIRKIIKESLKPVPKVGDFLYCHTEGVGPKVGDYVEVTNFESRGGNRGEDIISIGGVRNRGQHTARFTVQKDVVGRNYEDWFTLIPPDIQNTDFFGQLYESEDDLSWVKDLDSTNLLKVGQKFSIPSKIPGGSPILAVITKVTDRVVYILPANLPASYPSKGTPFDIGKLLKILNSGAWKVVESNLNESEDDFEWAKELTKFPEVVVTRSAAYYPTYTEFMLNVKIPGMEEFNQKYGKHWWDSEDYHNLSRRYEMGEGIKGDVGTLFLHQQVPSLGTPENGDICYLINNTETNEYDERISHLVRKSDGKHFIINADGYRPARKRVSKIREQEDELEWARDLVSGVENYWDVFKQSNPKNLDKLKFKLIPKSNGSDYFKESLDLCSFNGNVEWWFKQVFRIGKIKQMVRSGSDCEAGFNFGMDIDEDVLSAQLVECLTDNVLDLPYWINEDMVDIIVIE